MYETSKPSSRRRGGGGLATPRRNRFFYGKMMDVHQFELETAYGIDMRRLFNRLAVGRGVVCGLDVVPGDAPCSIVVTSGIALDGSGREIIVPADTAPVTIPQSLIDRVCGTGSPPGKEYDDGRDPSNGGGYRSGGAEGTRQADDAGGTEEGGYDQDQGADRRPDYEDRDRDDYHNDGRDDAWVTVTLCYHECETDPVVVLAGDCSTTTPCAPGAIEEKYSIGFEPGSADPVEVSCRFPDVLRHGEIDYGELARWVTRECPAPPRNPCIPLANVRLDCRADGCDIERIEIEIRPIVFGNDLMLDLFSRLADEMRSDAGAR
jgi:hypothetical protein